MQKNPVLGASQKLEFQKKRNSNFLNARNPSAWSFSKLEFQKKRNSNLPPQNLQCFTGNFFLLNPKIAKIHENSPATWIVYRHFFSHFLGFSVQGKKIPVAFWALDGPEVRVPKKKGTLTFFWNSNFFLGGPNFFQHWSMFDSDFCPDYILPVGHMNKPGFGKSDLDVLEFREVEINDSESKMFITRFCRQNAQLSHWSDNVSGLMWACTLILCSKSLCDQVSRPFFLSWLLATGYPALCGNQTSASSGVF